MPSMGDTRLGAPPLASLNRLFPEIRPFVRGHCRLTILSHRYQAKALARPGCPAPSAGPSPISACTPRANVLRPTRHFWGHASPAKLSPPPPGCWTSFRARQSGDSRMTHGPHLDSLRGGRDPKARPPNPSRGRSTAISSSFLSQHTRPDRATLELVRIK